VNLNPAALLWVVGPPLLGSVSPPAIWGHQFKFLSLSRTAEVVLVQHFKQGAPAGAGGSYL
jgi:hypothetical protein